MHTQYNKYTQDNYNNTQGQLKQLPTRQLKKTSNNTQETN